MKSSLAPPAIVVASTLALASFVAVACGGSDGASIAAPGNTDGGTGGAASSSSGSSGSSSGSSGGTTPSGDAATEAGPAGGSSYDKDGPLTFTASKATVANGPSSFSLDLYVPDGPGARPVVSLSPGFLQPAAAYAPFAKRLASFGIIVLVRDDPGFLTATPAVAADIAHVVSTWLPAESTKPGGTLSGKIDLAHVGLAGHSRGGKATLLAAEEGLKGKVAAWFGLDPVDVAAIGDPSKARDGLGAIGIPLAMIGAEVASTCSPATDTYAALFAAAKSPTVLVVGKGAGHTQLQDPAACNQCNLCTPGGTADTNEVLAYSIRYLTAFFARELLGDTSVGPTFDGAGAQADITAGRITVSSK